jgi:hypothetical protein
MVHPMDIWLTLGSLACGYIKYNDLEAVKWNW